MSTNPHYPYQPPIDPLYAQSLELRSVNQTWYSDRLRNENLDLMRDNNILIQDNRYYLDRMNQVNQEQQQRIERMQEENQQQCRVIGEMERNYNEELKNSDIHHQEIYRMRIQYDDMRSHLEKIVAEKDSIIIDLRRRLAEALSDRDGHLEARIDLEKSYRKGLHTSLSSRGDHPSLTDSKTFGHRVQISQVPGQEGEGTGEEDYQTVPKEKGSEMNYRNTVGVKRQESENMKLKEELRQKTQENLDLQNKLHAMKQKYERQLEDEKRNDRKRSQFNNTMQQLPFQAENDDLRNKKMEAEGIVKRSQEENRQLQSKLRENNVKMEALQKKVKTLEAQEKMRWQAKEQEDEDDEQKEDKAPSHMVIKVAEDRNLLDGVIALMHYLRESIVDMIFEVFVRSANQANVRKTNSLIIFSINLKELKEKNIRGFIIVLFLYKKMKQLLKMYYPNYGKSQILDDMHVKMSLGKNAQLGANPTDFRDEINTWLETSLKQCKFKRDHQEKEETNRDLNYLFRLLSLKYRMKYPLKGSAYQSDLDLKIRLENKISSAMLMCFADE